MLWEMSWVILKAGWPCAVSGPWKSAFSARVEVQKSWSHGFNGALTKFDPTPDSEEHSVQAVLGKVFHASLQDEQWIRQQMPNGFGPVFSIVLQSEYQARHLPGKLAFFQHATSLGGVESLIEWRTLSDSRVDRRLLRISVGLEDWEGLKNEIFFLFLANLK